METESLAAAATMLVLGLGVAAVGLLGVRLRISSALGGWTRESATVESGEGAPRTIGAWLVAAGAIAVASGLIALLAPSDRTGAIVVGSIVMLVPTVVGIASGLGTLERR